jgi:hypothetical protein
MLEIHIEMDKVFIEGQLVIRPDRMSRSDWMRFWEVAKAAWEVACGKGDIGDILTQ